MKPLANQGPVPAPPDQWWPSGLPVVSPLFSVRVKVVARGRSDRHVPHITGIIWKLETLNKPKPQAGHSNHLLRDKSGINEKV